MFPDMRIIWKILISHSVSYDSYYAFTCVSHILDNFIFIGPEGSTWRERQLRTFLSTTAYICIPIKHSKTILPMHVAPIHGIQVDTKAMEVQLLQDKLTTCKEKLCKFCRCQSVWLREWQSLIGTLSFAARVVRPGCQHIHRFINAIQQCSNPNHHIKLNAAIRRDCDVASVPHFLYRCVITESTHAGNISLHATLIWCLWVGICGHIPLFLVPRSMAYSMEETTY